MLSNDVTDLTTVTIGSQTITITSADYLETSTKEWTIYGGFQTTACVAGSSTIGISASDTMTIKINEVRLPKSIFTTTESFIISTADSTGSLINIDNDGMEVTADEPG